MIATANGKNHFAILIIVRQSMAWRLRAVAALAPRPGMEEYVCTTQLSGSTRIFIANTLPSRSRSILAEPSWRLASLMLGPWTSLTLQIHFRCWRART